MPVAGVCRSRWDTFVMLGVSGAVHVAQLVKALGPPGRLVRARAVVDRHFQPDVAPDAGCPLLLRLHLDGGGEDEAQHHLGGDRAVHSRRRGALPSGTPVAKKSPENAQ